MSYVFAYMVKYLSSWLLGAEIFDGKEFDKCSSWTSHDRHPYLAGNVFCFSPSLNLDLKGNKLLCNSSVSLALQDCAVGLLFALLPVLGGNSGILQGVISMSKV